MSFKIADRSITFVDKNKNEKYFKNLSDVYSFIFGTNIINIPEKFHLICINNQIKIHIGSYDPNIFMINIKMFAYNIKDSIFNYNYQHLSIFIKFLEKEFKEEMEISKKRLDLYDRISKKASKKYKQNFKNSVNFINSLFRKAVKIVEKRKANEKT